MSGAIQAFDWAGTPLGPLETWPTALGTLVDVMLGSKQPMFVAWGGEHTLLYNDGYAEILGRKHPAALGRPFFDVWPEIADDLVPLVDQVYAGQSVHMDKIELVVERHGFPEEAYFAFSYTPVRDNATGAVAGFFCPCMETTRQVVTERLLRESETQFRALAQAIPNHTWTATPDGSIVWLNQQASAYCGLDREALAGQGWARIVHPGDLGRMAARWRQALPAGTTFKVEVRLRSASGYYRWHLVQAQPVHGEDGAVVQWVGTNTDIEEQRAAQDTLAELNVELERRVAEHTAERDRVWQNSRDLLVIVGADGVFRAANPAWTTILGYRPEELIGQSFRAFIWPEDAELTQRGLDRAAARSDLQDFENRYRHKDGTPRRISWQTSTVGDLIYAYGRDVTAEREQAEALLEVEEQLRQSQKMEAVGQLTGGIAHDFNNLLTGIIGSLQLLQTRLAQGRVNDLERYITGAQGAAKRAASLTHRLLAFSRRQTLDPKPTDVNRLVGGMEELIRRTLGPEILLEMVPADGLWTTLVDQHQLENALLNLCINARDAMPEGGRLHIETDNKCFGAQAARARDLPPGQYVSLCVRDNGVGMAPEVMARAFDPFFTTKPIGSGTGLGLSMIYGFVRQSGGQARIDSEPGGGTLICLYLPRYAGEADVDDRPAAPSEAPRLDRTETVLVVDDEPTVRALVTEVLEDFGLSALEAGDGPSGLAILQSDARIDVLVTDVGLPGRMNGRQMADAGRLVRPDLKVLFITGYAENAALSGGQLEPGMRLLTKPFAVETLASRIKELMPGR
jgi:PAS domain S-box-containing protein